jgi:hypothetical protein
MRQCIIALERGAEGRERGAQGKQRADNDMSTPLAAHNDVGGVPFAEATREEELERSRLLWRGATGAQQEQQPLHSSEMGVC